MSSLTVQLDPTDQTRLAGEISRQVVEALKPLFENLSTRREERVIGFGVRVLNTAEVAALKNVSVRHLKNLEIDGRLPRRRYLSSRRAIYLEHEIEGTPVEAIKAPRHRRLGVGQLAYKLGVHPRTLLQLRNLPAPEEDGTWSERDIDDWLIHLPLA